MKVLAFNLPQFHPIPENDEWWGKGFTEWTNVTRAVPLVPGHQQPHLPADLGFYDLRLPEARAAQANLAMQYGIDGFVYYHYWFNGRRLLNRPVDDILSSGQPDFPFCLCWANEDWTRAWDGRSGQPLLAQHYSSDDDEAHIHHLLPALADPRYIRVDGRPLLLIYRAERLPAPSRTAEMWRKAAQSSGLGDIFLGRVESFQSDINPASIGFDCAVEFAPDWRHAQPMVFGRRKRLLSRLGLLPKAWLEHRFIPYSDLVLRMRAKPKVAYLRYRCVAPRFDNSPRRKRDATVFLGSTPQAYGDWLESTLREELGSGRTKDQQLVFINAWNEWGEGNHLEPDQHWGLGYLEATRRALDSIDGIVDK